MIEIKIGEPLDLVSARHVTPEKLDEVRRLVTTEAKKIFSQQETARRNWVSADFYRPLRSAA